MTQGHNMILSNKGVVDTYMHRDPNDTVFSTVHVNHTLSVEWCKEILENGNTSSGLGSNGTRTSTYNLHDTGDALSFIALQTSFPALTRYGAADHMHLVNAGGFGCVDKYVVKMGNLDYETQDSILMFALEELTIAPDQRCVEESGNYGKESLLIQAAKGAQVFQVPLRPWFVEDEATSLKICAHGNNALSIVVYWDKFQNWIVNRGADVWDANLIRDVQDQLSLASAKLIGRYHFMEESERAFYMHTPMINLHTFHQKDQVLLSSKKEETLQIQFNFPVTALLAIAQSSAAFDGQYYPGKVGTKDKFWFGTPSGVEPIQDLDFVLNNNSIIKGYGLNSLFGRTHQAIRAFGYKPHQPMQVFPFQRNAHKKKDIASCNFSRFENVKGTFKFGETSPELSNNFHLYAVARNLFTVDYGFANKPFAA